MAAEKLFYQDTHMTAFTARVTGCGRDKQGAYVTLDRTAFYPEGGGQPTDLGRINDAAVSLVKELEGDIRHYTSGSFSVGEEVQGCIDAKRRKDLTEQHSGEHMVSGLICTHFHCDNVGFHISDPFVTIDFNTTATMEELLRIEEQANALIRADLPVHIFWPSPEELKALDYRSKKELSGAVRIVEFPEADICACCGTHVVRTGEIGLVKLVHMQPHRGGIRIEMLCGGRALRYLSEALRENQRISTLLSARENDTAGAVSRLMKENQGRKERLAVLEEAAIASKAAAVSGKGPVLMTEQGMEAASARRLADALAGSCGALAAVLSDCGEEGIRYAIVSPGGGLKSFAPILNKAFSGRGGGSEELIQGSLRGSVEPISAFLSEHIPGLCRC